MRRWIILFALVLMASLGCTRSEPVRIGSKLFAENQILAEMMAALAEDQGIPVEKVVPFGNTFALQQAMRKKQLDLYPEYTGTGTVIMGAVAPRKGEETLEAVRRMYKPLGMTWEKPFGFNNSYVVVVTPAKAAEWGLESIGDLAEREEPITIGADPEFLKRPVDGMESLIRRYGIAPQPETKGIERSEGLYGGLLSGKLDVVIGNRTDFHIDEFNLTILEDNLDFFPVYEAAPLVRTTVLEKYPGLAAALEQLAGRLDVETMRRLNLEVDRHGLGPEEVAINWLTQQGMPVSRPPRPYQPALMVAAPPMDETPPSTAAALKAMRQVFPDRPVTLNTVALPVESLRQGLAFVAVLGAEHFFQAHDGFSPTLVEGIEAVAPLGYRVAHLFTPPGRPPTKEPFRGIRRLGVGLKNGASERAARFLVDAYGADVKLVIGDPEQQAADVERNKLDGLLLMARQSDAGIIVMLNRHRLSLQPLADWGKEDRTHRYPFFRLTRIPAGTYPGQNDIIETVGAQVVLAGPKPEEKPWGIGDPVSGLRSQRDPLPDELKRRIVKALNVKEAVDPVLPGRNPALVRHAPAAPQPLNPNPTASWLNGIFLATLVVFFMLLGRLGRKRES